MANQKLLQAIESVQAIDPYKGKAIVKSNPSRADIKLNPLESRSMDVASTDAATLAPMTLKAPEREGSSYIPGEHFKPTPTINDIIDPNGIIPKQEPFSLLRKDDYNFNWDDIEDRRILLDAQLKAESGYNAGANSPAGAQGIAQFMPGTWEEYQNKGFVPKDKTPYDVGAALQGQRKYMERMFGRDLIKQHPDSLTQIKMALAGYNAGPGNVSKAVRIANEKGTPDEWMQYLPRKGETIPYIQRILDIAKSHKKSSYNPEYNWGYRKQGGILRTTTKS